MPDATLKFLEGRCLTFDCHVRIDVEDLQRDTQDATRPLASPDSLQLR